MVAAALDSLDPADLAPGGPVFFQHLSGGEATADPDLLLEIVAAIRARFAGDLGLSTNGWWAVDPGAAALFAARLAAAGVSGVSVSSDAYHAAGDPERARRADLAVAAVEAAGLGRHSWVLSCLPAALPGPKGKSRVARSSVRAGRMPAAGIELRAIGRGSALLSPFAREEVPQAPCARLSECLGERSPFDPAMLWIDPYGTVLACYGLAIGNLRDGSLARIVSSYDPGADPVLEALVSEGPKGLYRLARERGLDPGSRFFDECDLCWRSRKALRPAFPGTLGPAECYP